MKNGKRRRPKGMTGSRNKKWITEKKVREDRLHAMNQELQLLKTLEEDNKAMKDLRSTTSDQTSGTNRRLLEEPEKSALNDLNQVQIWDAFLMGQAFGSSTT